MSVRVRFAPSPTGFVHIGSLRTALYNYLFAKHHGGVNILRIEDTDRTRFVEGAEEEIIATCRWAGIEFDESTEKGGPFGPYRQSERTEIYREHAAMLLDNGNAYYAFDTSEELDKMRERQQAAGIAPKYDRSIMRNQYTLGEDETRRLLDEGAEYCIRMKVPLHAEISFVDSIRGPVTFQSRDVDDQILMKSDGFPTYHLANVVDDRLMQITHVIRGEEWLPSTPKHVLLYQAFGWEAPQFAHLPLLLNEDRSKMSKRKGDVFVYQFREKGFFAETLVNFVALLGWNPTADREMFTLQEMIDTFTLEKVNKAGAVFDYKKLEWMQSEYMKKSAPQNFVSVVKQELENKGINGIDDDYVVRVITLLRERVQFPHQIADFGNYMFEIPKSYDDEFRAKVWTEKAQQALPEVIALLRSAEDFNHTALHQTVQAYLAEKKMGFKDVMNPLRLLVTGKSVGAGMFETMEVLGKQATLERIDAMLGLLTH